MLSYRHAFHAGNHADVLKHVVLVQLLEYLTRKPKPLWYVDTHAGAGIYPLDRGLAARHQEFGEGIRKLWDKTDLPAAVEQYVARVRALNPEGKLTRYPGSAWFARQQLRPDDHLWLYELHPTDYTTISGAVTGKTVHVAREDGLQALRGLLPPQPRRALVLVDPSYEIKTDYQQVVATLQDALKRFPGGTYAIWYPLLDTPAAQTLPGKLVKLHGGSWLHAQLQVRSADTGRGMYGSGMYVVNPPYTLPTLLNDALPALATLLKQDDSANTHLEWQID